MHLHGTITPGPLTSEHRMRRAEIDAGPRLQHHPDLRQRRHRHDQLRPDLPRRPDPRLRLAAPTLHGAHAAGCTASTRAGAATAKTSSSSTSSRRCSTRLSTSDRRDVRAATPDARRPGRHRHVRGQHDRQPAVLQGRRVAARPATTTSINVLDTGAPDRRLRRPDRQRLRQHDVQRLRGRRADDPVRDRRHLPAARVELHRLDADLGHARTSSPTTRPSSRSSTATSAYRSSPVTTGDITL